MKEITIGQKFVRLTILKLAEKDKNSNKRWFCKCECGNERKILQNNLTRGKTKSCGCLNKEVVKNRFTTHEMSNTRIYKSWASLLQRCNNSNATAYKGWGGRGITVCKSWYKFINFYKDMGNSYRDDLQIDRIDNNKGYFKENCKWSTSIEQNNNKRDNHFIEWQRKRKTIAQWARELNINAGTLKSRINESKWPIEKALFYRMKAYRNAQHEK